MAENTGGDPAPRDGEASCYARLHPVAGVVFDRGSCLSIQSPYLSCQRCADACPAGVLHGTADALVLNDGCLQCGRCVAACPTGALNVPGFAVTACATGPVQVDCWKVPPEESPAGALRVPCLGGVAVSQWLALAATREAQAVVALDRGWCGKCQAGSPKARPATVALDGARELMALLDKPAARLLKLERRPLPRKRMARAIPDKDPAVTLDRRGFLKGLGRQMVAAAVGPQDDEAALAAPTRLRPGALHAPEHESRLLWLATLARRRGIALPARLFSGIAMNERCTNHQVCAAVCPTGALARYEAQGESGVVFDAWACIGCAACERACPEQALRHAPAGTLALTPVALTRHRLAECRDCGSPFTPRANEDLCPACDKTRAAFAPFLARPAGTMNPNSPEEESRA